MKKALIIEESFFKSVEGDAWDAVIYYDAEEDIVRIVTMDDDGDEAALLLSKEEVAAIAELFLID